MLKWMKEWLEVWPVTATWNLVACKILRFQRNWFMFAIVFVLIYRSKTHLTLMSLCQQVWEKNPLFNRAAWNHYLHSTQKSSSEYRVFCQWHRVNSRDTWWWIIDTQPYRYYDLGGEGWHGSCELFLLTYIPKTMTWWD